jgi:hypothetical protein
MVLNKVWGGIPSKLSQKVFKERSNNNIKICKPCTCFRPLIGKYDAGKMDFKSIYYLDKLLFLVIHSISSMHSFHFI